jgi:Ni,Fe-hydrogenase III large subunit
MRELLGFEPRGHPDPRPLLLDRPGTTPLRKDFAPGASLAPAPPARPPVVVEGEGTYEVTLGPGATGIGEAACLRIAAFGDRVIHFEPLLFRKHRGAEKRAEGLSPRKAVVLAERLCGSCSVANAAALTLAIERLARSEPPARATWMRTAAIELERILSHAAALGAACAAAGWGAAEGLFLRARERLLAAVEEALGSRLLRGIVAPGGVRRDLEAGPARSLARAVRGAAAALGRASDAVVASASLRQRLEGLGAVSPALAVELDLLGPSARASGSRRDARRDHPHLAYPELRFWVPVYVAGDALARFRVRTDEVEQSCAVVAEVLEGLPEGRTAVEVGPPAPAGRALGVVESARGLTLHALHTDGRGAIDRWHVRAPSQTGWRALAAAAPGCVLEDLALLHTSFDLCVSCVDR